MSHRRIRVFRVVPLLGAFITYGCGQTPDSSQPSLDSDGTSTTSSSHGSPSASTPTITSVPVAPSTTHAPSTSANVPSSSSVQPVSSAAPNDSSSSEAFTSEPGGSSSDVNTDHTLETSAGVSSEPAETADTTEDIDPGDTSEPEATSEDSEPNPGNVINGPGGVVNATIVVHAGEIYDGGGKTFTAGNALGDGSQSEDQLPVFRLEDGAQIRNVTLGSPAADGIHCYGDVTLTNIHWQDIGEDALTIKESGTVTLDGGSAQNGDDKVFQINAASTFIVRNFTARNAGKFIRQNGDTTFRVDVVIEDCDISQMDECIFRTDSSSSTVTMRDTRYSDLGDGLFVGVNQNNITVSNNTEY